MDFKNRSIPFDNVTSFDVNKAIQRSLTKAVARHGLGLYIYAGEDLPEAEAEQATEQPKKEQPKKVKTPRERLIAKLYEKGIDVTAYAAEKGLDNKTTNERFEELLKELG